MCGIYASNLPLNKEIINKKLNSINFRGPDNLGIINTNDIFLGHLRLSILDLDKRSNQPFNYKHLSITFNGEIYNYIDIKVELQELGFVFSTESDTEVLLIGFYHWGKDVLKKINGMFAFCIYDSLKNELFCARDRLGVKPFYYYWKNAKFEICSQLRPLINSNSEINEEAINIYLSCGYIPSPYSAIQNVHKLPPGNYLTIDLNSNKLIINPFWDLQKVKYNKLSYEQTKNELHDLIKDSVKIRMQSDVSFGSFLSGGIDSALITSIASNLSEMPINTFSIGFNEDQYDESKLAEKYSEILKTNHKTIMCSSEDILNLIPTHKYVFDEPFADSSALPSLLLNKATKNFVTVALSGDGGDESFLGYRYFANLNKFKYLFQTPLVLKNILFKPMFLKVLLKLRKFPLDLLSINSTDEYAVYYFTDIDNLQKNKYTDWLKHYIKFKKLSKDFLQRAADLNIKLWLENDSNVKVDRASMAYSVEVRSPFLDYRIIEKARNIPRKYRFNNKIQKRIIRDILSEYIPKEIFNHPKKGFSVPLENWIRNELRNEFNSKLTDEFLNIVPNLDVIKFKKQFELHMADKADFKSNIWKMYVLRQWYDEFGFFKEKTNA